LYSCEVREEIVMATIGMSVRLDVPLDEALQRARTALAEQGFGILAEIDVAATLQAKLGVEVAPQVILGACNAPLAREGLRIEPDLGLLLPCNVVVRVADDGTTLVSALDPELLVSVPGRPELEPIAAEARTRLQSALATIAAVAS
jgi:uncharacterized protein (DUF302 family)